MVLNPTLLIAIRNTLVQPELAMFLQLGRRSLRGEDWVDIAEKVSDALKSMKNEAQCRRMIDGLKRKFKKEKSKAERMGLNSSKWVFFRKMEMLMGLGSSSFRQQESWLACGVDSGEFVFMNPQRFSKIYEKIESSKREHMKELEKMRMDFQKELELICLEDKYVASS
ncbi:hypothetical protein GOBAR_AA22704 [Gossypium barbadense]|uniref:Myb/SANT-like DNA-binding domain-containing protein n=1 Tax=Gossypium barbadense TaxID=3634 RepID=A0A2P5X3Q5_GOSBA|nr:hypothetical protein GOBAR_AA22704 [Gossypium barbadense]